MANCSTTTGKRFSLHVYVTLIRRAKLQQLASFKKKISEFNNSQSKNYAWIAGNWVLVREWWGSDYANGKSFWRMV